MAKFKFSSFLVAAFIMLSVAVTPALAASKAKIDRRVKQTLSDFQQQVRGGDALLKDAAGVLVFPHVTKAGIGIGGEKGDGALLIDGETVAYYQTVSASIGFQLGVQVRSQIIIFLEESALNDFRHSDGWEVGVDGSVALVDLGAGGAVDSRSYDEPVIGFIMSNKGLMYNLTLEGSNIRQIER